MEQGEGMSSDFSKYVMKEERKRRCPSKACVGCLLAQAHSAKAVCFEAVGNDPSCLKSTGWMVQPSSLVSFSEKWLCYKRYF